MDDAIMLFHNLSLSLVLFGLSASLSASDEGGDRYFGMTQQKFESCIRYGKAVLDSKASKNKIKGREVYEAARIEFKSHCDPKKQLSYAITHLVPKLGPDGIPVKPEDWAALDQPAASD
jgi:hypothetical protein